MKISLYHPIGWICLGLGLAAPLLASPLRWQAAFGTDAAVSSGKSDFVAVEAMPADGGGQPARAFLAGNIEKEFQFAGLPLLVADVWSGVVVRVSDQGGGDWNGDWLALAEGDDPVSIHDMAVSPLTGLIHVCGTSPKQVRLIDASGVQSQTVSTNSTHRGFVAWLDPETGAWLDGFRTNGIEPVSLAIAADGSILVSGEGCLAAKYSTTGQRLWKEPTPEKLQQWAHVATGTQPGDPHVYVLYRDKDSPTKEDVVLSQLDASDGDVLWTVRMGSPGEDTPGGLDVGPNGEVVVSYSAKNKLPSFAGQLVPGIYFNESTHAFIARLQADGSMDWVRPLGDDQVKGAKFLTQDLDIDPGGTAWVSGWADGPWSFAAGEMTSLDDDTLLLAVDSAGTLVRHEQTIGGAKESFCAVSAPIAEMVVIAGEYSEGMSYLPTEGHVFNGLFFSSRDKAGGFCALLLPSDWESQVDANRLPLRWRAALGTDGEISSGKSGFVAVEAMEADGTGQPARAFLAGNIQHEFQFADLPLIDSDKWRGVVVRLSHESGASPSGDWQALAQATEDVSIHDMAVSPVSGLIHVCGTSKRPVDLVDASGTISLTLPTNDDLRGFVAWLDPETGAWLGGFRTDALEPVSLAIRADGSIVVTGEGALAAKYSATGLVQWTSPEPDKLEAWSDIATGTQPGDPNVYVLFRDKDSPSKEDVVLSQLDAADGSVVWSVRMGSPGDDYPGGLAVGPDGAVTVSFSAKNKIPTFGGAPVPVRHATDAIHAFIARLQPDSSVDWVRPLGDALTQDAKSLTSDIDIDPDGTAWVCGWADGPWSFTEGETAHLFDDTLLLAVNTGGELVHYNQGLGEASDTPFAVSAPSAEMVVVVGDYLHGMSYLPSSGDVLPARGDKRGGFFALLLPSVWQQLMVVRPNAAHPDGEVREFVEEMIELWGLSTYASVDNGDDGTAVSIWMSEAEIAAFSEDEWMIIEPEIEIEASGTVVDPGWALACVADAEAIAATSYEYPETDGQVVLYLIDTAVANPNDWFGGNANVTLEESLLVRGVGDPVVSTAFAHGTRMLSLIAGPETGAAQGTPIRVINYDVFPNGETTTGTLVAKGVVEAARRHMQDSSGQPGVICLATSSEAGDISLTLRAAIDLAVANGLTVIVSAGNHGGDVMQHIPASYGIDPGIICVGASDQSNQRLAMSNFGAAVDLSAPGEAVRALCFDDPGCGENDYMTGTSPATALVAAAALVELSADPALTPAGVEGALLLDHYPAVVALVQIGDEAVMTPFEAWASQNFGEAGAVGPNDDADGDGITNMLEYFHGCSPVESNGSMMVLGQDPVSGQIDLSFPVSSDLFDPNDPLVLLDGTIWEIELSTDMVNWTAAAGILTWGAPVDGVVPVSFEPEQSYDTCFLRIKVMP